MDGKGGVRGLAGRMWGEAKEPLYRNAIFIMASSVIGTGLGFFFWVIVYQVYDPSDAGYGVTLTSTIAFLAGVATLGLGIGLIRFLPEADEPASLINSSLSISGLVGLALAFVFVLGAGIWAPELDFIQNPLYVAAILVTGMAYAFAPILDSAAIGLRRAELATWRNTAFSLIKIPLPLVFVLAFSGPLGGRMGVYLSIAVAFGVSVVLMGVAFLPWSLPGYRPRPRLSRRLVRPIFAFSVGNWIAAIVGSAGILLLPFLILRTIGQAGADDAGYFYAAYTVAGLLYVIPGATMTSLLAESSQQGAQRRQDERKAILLSLGLLAPGIAAMWVLARFILELFVSGTAESEIVERAVTPLRILAFAAIPAFLNGLLGTRLRIQKRVVPLIASAVAGTAVTLGAGYVLLLSMGLDGLAIAFVVGQVAAAPILWATARSPVDAAPIELVPTPPT